METTDEQTAARRSLPRVLRRPAALRSADPERARAPRVAGALEAPPPRRAAPVAPVAVAAPPKRVLLIDDHPVFATGLSAALRDDGAFVVASVARSCEQAERVLSARAFDAVVTELVLADAAGVTVIERVRSAAPDTPVVVLTSLPLADFLDDAIRAGARACLSKRWSPPLLVAALDAVAAGSLYVPLSGAPWIPALPAHEVLTRLTPREREVFALVGRGHTNREIAALFGRSVKTVEAHKQSMQRKLKLADAGALRVVALAHHIGACDRRRRPGA